MKLIDKLDKQELRELLVKNWMTHDAMWFYHTYKECGIDAANKINKASVRGLAAIEVKRLIKAMGKNEIKTFEELKDFFDEGFNVIKGDFMTVTYSFPERNVMVWDIPQCFAFDGMKKIGVIDQYACGIITRIMGWLDTLRIKYALIPEPGTCMLLEKERCSWEFRFEFY